MPSNMALTSLVVCADASSTGAQPHSAEMGIRAEHCGDPQQAIGRLKTDRFDALLVDCANEAPARQVVAAAKSSTTSKNSLVIAVRILRTTSVRLLRRASALFCTSRFQLIR
jgi:hypothetical protein